jgi:MFS family permease
MSRSRDLFGVLRHRDYRYVWLAHSSSVVGDRIVVVAVSLLVIKLTGDATDLGLVFAAWALALVSFLLIGGVWADRLPRHRVMVATDVVRFALHAALAALILSGEIRIWHLIVIEGLFGAAEAFFQPASTGLLPQTVPEDDIQPANALRTLSENVAEFAGPALATGLVLGPGAGWAFALDAATFLVSAALLLRVRPRERTSRGLGGAGQREPSMWQQIREGAREVRARAWVWATLAAFCAGLFFGLAPWYILGPVVARSQYGAIGVYGLVASALGIGTIAGSLIGIRWRPRYPMRYAMLAAATWPLVGVVYGSGVTLALVVPMSVLSGAAIALFDVWWTTALAEHIPPERLSRVSSYDWMVSLGLLPVGYALVGPLAHALGAVDVLLVGSALACLAFAAGLLPRETRMLARLESDASARAERARALPHHP